MAELGAVPGLGISVAGFHASACGAPAVPRGAPRRHIGDAALLLHIKAIYAQTRGGYGWPRTWKALRAGGLRVGKEGVRKLMQVHGIRARGKRRFSWRW